MERLAAPSHFHDTTSSHHHQPHHSSSWGSSTLPHNSSASRSAPQYHQQQQYLHHQYGAPPTTGSNAPPFHQQVPPPQPSPSNPPPYNHHLHYHSQVGSSGAAPNHVRSRSTSGRELLLNTSLESSTGSSASNWRGVASSASQLQLSVAPPPQTAPIAYNNTNLTGTPYNNSLNNSFSSNTALNTSFGAVSTNSGVHSSMEIVKKQVDLRE